MGVFNLSLKITAFVAIVLVAVVSVVLINPKVTNENGKSVAGVNTYKTGVERLTFEESIFNTKEYTTYLSENEEYYEYKALINSSEKTLEYSLIKFYNFGDTDVKIEIGASLNENVLGKVRIEIKDAQDTIILVNNSERYVRTLTIPKSSSRSINVVYKLEENINFPFEAIFTIK